MSGTVQNLTEKDFSEKIKNKTVLIEFWAPWCHGCKAVTPHLDELAKMYNDDIFFFKVNVTNNPGLAGRFGVMSLPNMIFFKNGKIIDQIIGATTKKVIEERVKKALK